MANEVKIEGLDVLQKVLELLPARIEANIMRGAVRAGSKVLADSAKSRAPVDSGDLKKSIRVSTRSRRGQVSASVRAGDKRAFYAHMVEYGTASFYTGDGKSVGGPYKISPTKTQTPKQAVSFDTTARASVTHPGIRPQPFMRPALDNDSQNAVQAVADYVRGRLIKEATKK